MTDAIEYFNQVLEKDEGVRREYEKQTPYFEMMKSLIEARLQREMTQQDLSDLTKIDRANINRIERGKANPSLKTLFRLAEALDCTLRIEFIPKDSH